MGEVAAQIGFWAATAAAERLERLLTRRGRELSGEEGPEPVPEWALDLEPAPLREVLGALDFAGAVKLGPPLAVVVPLSEAAGENRAGWGATSQQVILTLGVVVMVAAPNDPGGERARSRDALSDTLRAVRAALIGWVPPGFLAQPLTYARGRLLEIEDGRITWQDELEARYRITAHEGAEPCDPPVEVCVRGGPAPDVQRIGPGSSEGDGEPVIVVAGEVS